MKIQHLLLMLISTLVSCSNEESSLSLDPGINASFDGSFEHKEETESATGTINLNIENGKYLCSTDEPYGQGAGNISISGSIINFKDTLSPIIPGLYNRGNILIGEHNYSLKGNTLKLWKSGNSWQVHYHLKQK